MPDLRAFCPLPASGGALLTLDPDESHHLVSVHRARPDDPVTAFNGHGTEAACVVVAADRRAATLRVTSVRQAPPLPVRITLAQALPKGPAFDAIVRKATELGAARVVPLATERTEVHLSDERADRKTEKWRATAIEAAKQCGNPWLPEIASVQTLDAFLADVGKFDLRLLGSLSPSAVSLAAALGKGTAIAAKPVWLIGPEGDFTPREQAAAEHAGFKSVTLGPLVLRSETAAVAALVMLAYALQNP